MFLHSDGSSAGVIAIPQTSHAWMAWQIAMHWGNRRFARPAPRAEVLAAIMLHDVGWTEFDIDPGIDDRGRPITFDRMPVAEHLEIWRASVLRAAAFSRYAGLLVANHFFGLVEHKSNDLLERGDTVGGRAAEAFRAEMDRLQSSWRESLRGDPRYAPYLNGEGWSVNTGLLVACDRISVYLCAALGSPFTLPGRTSDGQIEEIRVSNVGGDRWRVQPWPLEGDRLKLQVEGRRLASARFASREAVRNALVRSPVERMSAVLVRPSAG